MKVKLNEDLKEPLNKKQKIKTSPSSCFYSFLCWTFQLLIWISLISILIMERLHIRYSEYQLYILFFSYIIYIILELCSSTCRFLIDKKENLYTRLKKIYSSLPKILFKCECYHYVTTQYTVTDSKGRTHTRTHTEKVVTHRETYSFPYYSFQDVSGLFILNQNVKEMKNTVFIKLELDKEINFADNISYYDYLMQKQHFYTTNKNRDSYMDMWEIREIPDFKKYHFIKIRDKNICTIGLFIYLLSVFLTFAQFYKYYVNCYSAYKNYKIRKIISTRNDLQYIKFRDNLFPLIPTIQFLDKKYDFKRNDTSFCFRQFKPATPNENEIHEADIYKNEVPLYQINLQSGEVENIPYFNEKDYNKNNQYKDVVRCNNYNINYLIDTNDNYERLADNTDNIEIQLIHD